MPLRVASLSLIAAFVTLALGCETPSPQTPKTWPYPVSPAQAEILGYDIGWSTDVSGYTGSEVTYADVLGDVVVTIEEPDNIVTAVDAKTGKFLWKASAGKPGEKVYGPYRHEDRILVNTDRKMWAYDRDSGKILDVFRLRSIVDHDPALLGAMAFFGGADGRAFAINVTTGQKPWEYQMTAAFDARPLVVGDNVFVADGAGVYAMLDGYTGNVLFRGRAFGPVVADPTADTVRVYVPSRDQALYALDRNTGRDRWTPYRTTMPLTYSALPDNRHVFLPLPGKGLVALESATGNVAWQNEVPSQPVGIVREKLLAKSPGSLALMEVDTGRLLATAKTDTLAAVRITDDQRLYLVGRDGKIVQLNPDR